MSNKYDSEDHIEFNIIGWIAVITVIGILIFSGWNIGDWIGLTRPLRNHLHTHLIKIFEKLL